FIDFRERAPEKSTRDMYLDASGKPTPESVDGWRASGVPGTVRGFEFAQQKYGRRKWGDLGQPAVELASRGVPVSYSLAQSLKGASSLAPEAKAIFQRKGQFYDTGETLTQPALARTLDRIAKSGSKDFYEGETAERIAAEMAKHGGIVTLADL